MDIKENGMNREVSKPVSRMRFGIARILSMLILLFMTMYVTAKSQSRNPRLFLVT